VKKAGQAQTQIGSLLENSPTRWRHIAIGWLRTQRIEPRFERSG